MTILSRLSGAQGRRDEGPNKDLGQELADSRDVEGIQTIAENLWNEDKRVRTDCLSVLEQVGLLDPALIEAYVADFLELAFGKDNRLAWAAMINLALVADRRPGEIFERFDQLVQVIDKGSVITVDAGIKTLAKVASTSREYKEAVMPYLLEQLGSCRPKSVPQYAESIRCAIDPDSEEQYLGILNERLSTLSAAQQRRVKKLLRTF
jgi:hypothetical protein